MGLFSRSGLKFRLFFFHMGVFLRAGSYHNLRKTPIPSGAGQYFVPNLILSKPRKDILRSYGSEDSRVLVKMKGKSKFHGDGSLPSILDSLNFFDSKRGMCHIVQKLYAVLYLLSTVSLRRLGGRAPKAAIGIAPAAAVSVSPAAAVGGRIGLRP
jgi:hypothetical protein